MLRRFLVLIFTLLLIFIATRGMIRLLPGDPIDVLVAETGTKIPHAQLRADLHLDLPWPSALVHDLREMLRGNFGISLISRRPVLSILRENLLPSILLSLTSLSIGLIMSLTLAILAIRFTVFHWICSTWGITTAALPSIIIGPLILALTYHFDSILPAAMAIAIPFTGTWSRLIRSRIRDTLQLSFVQAARSRGLSESKIIFKYALFPALGALAAQFGTHAGLVFAGWAMVTEFVFNRAGMGTLMVDSVLKRDYPLIESAVLVSAVFCLLGTTLGDWAQSWIDPRLKNPEEAKSL